MERITWARNFTFHHPPAPIIEAFQQNQVKYDKRETEMKNAFQRNKNRVDN